LDLNAFAPDAVVPGETWAAGQAGTFDFLADWFSDDMVPMILDDEEMFVDESLSWKIMMDGTEEAYYVISSSTCTYSEQLGFARDCTISNFA
jgi:hypothetical protein